MFVVLTAIPTGWYINRPVGMGYYADASAA
jgi:hypothetical protein